MNPIERHATRRLGTTLRGRYRLDALLGVGDLGAVYRATHCEETELAVKVLHPELSQREDVRYRFLRDLYAANSVRHPGVVLVVDDDVDDDGNAFIVTELVDGVDCETLRVRSGGRLPLVQACAVARDVLDVLVTAHGKGFLHRDIRLGNIFVTGAGRTKLLDFGAARVRETAGSRPPMGIDAQTDVHLDLWAVGAALYTLVTGMPPRRALATVLPEAPPGLQRVVDRALATERGDRWPDARTMRAALADVLVAFH